ncbi:hypothetical protein [Dactylosporangium sp. NPDC049140]|uniref:hypothetical protein n=1 Tax=Dactylosporangium sp. NPDC049140 TaxID=3155647 RepID=UPI0033E78C96
MRQTSARPFLAVGAGAAAVLVFWGAAAAVLFALWARSWSTGPPSSTCAEFSCARPGDFRALATTLFTVVVAVGTGIGIVIVALTVAVLSGATSWRPRPGSGALAAVALGTAAAAVGSCLSVPLLLLLARFG